jgi:pyruvate dehydrogenase E1 component beta subunit
MARMTFVEATRASLADEMRRDATIWALGEDLAGGGLYGQYRGLIDEFGPRRIVSTPISEATIVGAGLGAALVGTRPVIEIRIADFVMCAMDELVNQIAKARYMFGGQARVPVVVRLPQGIMRNSAAQHSQSLEAVYAHVPGLIVVAPATPADSGGLLKAATRCDDPVVFLEPKALWTQTGDVPDDVPAVPIGSARIAREGSDVTIVAWSAMVETVLAAAELSAERGIACEVIDLRTIWPWDQQAVLASVARTRRLLVVHESVRVGGFGAEIAATIAEQMGSELTAPVRRLGGVRAPVPFSPVLEQRYRIEAPAIAATVQQMCVQVHA